jgi:hypothetical protein
VAIPASNTITETNSLPVLEEVEFSIGQNVEDQRFVMSSLAKLYSDLTAATVREYATNAHDEHIRHGIKRPIEVTLPSAINNYYVVRDFAKGMSRADLTKIFTSFGTSTKRKSNDFNGLLGYGSKVAAAYTTKFTVTSIHNGVRTEAMVSRKPNNAITLAVIEEEKTDEPSGVTIRVPVHNVDKFNYAAQEFFKFWLPGSVLVNGKAPKHDVGKKIHDGLYHLAGYAWNTSYIVMGNVAYKINNPQALFRDSAMSQINFVAYVDNAEVEFTPSREDLLYDSEVTQSTLKRIVKDFEAKILAQAKAEIDQSKNHAEAYETWFKWVTIVGRDIFGTLTFRGETLKDKFPFSGHRWKTSGGRGAATTIREWQNSWMENAMIVTDYGINMSSATKAKMNDWFLVQKEKDANFVKPTYVLFTSATSIDNKWLDASKIYTWESIKAVIPKKPKRVATSGYAWNAGRVPGSWDYWDGKGNFYEEKEIPKDIKVYWISLQNAKRRSMYNLLGALGEECVVIRLPANRAAKFHREHPEITSIIAHAKSKVVKDTETLLSDAAKKTFGVNLSTQSLVNSLDADKVDDPRFAELRDALRDKTALRAKYDNNLSLASQCGMLYDVKKYEPVRVDLMKDYPLAEYHTGQRNKEHLTIYINAVYAANKEKK